MRRALTRPSEIILGEVVRRFVGKVINKPSVTEGAVCDVCYTQSSGRFNKPVSLVQGLECGILCLEGINLGN